MPRTYTKRSDYWSQPRTVQPAAAPQPPVIVNTGPAAKAGVRPTPFPDIVYGSTEVKTAIAGGVPASTTDYRSQQFNNGLVDPGAYQNIRGMMLPWAGFGQNSRQYWGMQNAIELCARAYTGVPVFRNAVEVAVEFSNQPFFIKTKNQTVKTFFQEWFATVGMNSLREQFFREYYRSGNVFLYKFSGKFGPAYYKHFQQSFGMKANKIPIRYYLLNPANVFVPTGLTFPYTYVRLLSTYEIERLRNPQNEQDKQVYNDLPKFVQDQINVTSGYPLGVYIPMDPDRLRFAFYKKQSYEPLAIPMGYPIMADLEWKLTLKKMDMSLARTIEHAVLLVTTGETGTEYNGGNGININNIARLQNLFNNQTISRVLVADFTTEAEWLIPDVEKILGPEKYQIVNQDIQEGLQSIWGGGDKGGEKFSNAQTKAKIFVQRLDEGQNVFLNDFLRPEIDFVCEAMGFRDKPEVGFRKIDLNDDALMYRIYTQLAQLGIFTADQTVNAIETGVLPDADEMDAAQTQYVKDREKGKYLPLVGASVQDPAVPGGGTGGPPGGGKPGTGTPPGRPPGTSGIKKVVKSVGPIGTSRGSLAFSSKAYVQNLKASNQLVGEIEGKLQKRFKIKELSPAQSQVAQSLARTIMAVHPQKQWVKSIATTMAKPPAIPAEIAAEIDQISTEYEVDVMDATLLRLSKTDPVSTDAA